MALATLAELAAYLQKDVDNSTGTLALNVASALFERESAAKFSSTAATYQVEGRGQPVIAIPNEPLISVNQVRIAGVVIASTEYTVVMQNLYRTVGWGRVWGPTLATAPYITFPPELVEVDYTYGFTSVPDDVKGAVLETAGGAYLNPDLATTAEAIDDYRVEFSRTGGGVQLSPSALVLARKIKTGGFA